MAMVNNNLPLSSTVLQVIDTFAAALRADDGIPKAAAERMETLLRKGIVPKSDEVISTLFEPPPQSEQ